MADDDQVVERVSELMQNGDVYTAISQLDEALEEDPKNARFHYMKGCIYSELGQTEEAIAAYATSAKFAGDMATNPLYNLANIYKEQGYFAEAVETYKRVVDIDPTMTDAWINMGVMLDDEGHHKVAVDCYDAAIEVDSTDPMSWSNRGNSLRALEQFADAELSYTKALELDADDFAATVGLAVCVFEQGKDGGLEMLERAYGASRHPFALFELATALAKSDRTADALECFELLVDQGFSDPSMWNNRAECLAKLDRANEALESFDKAIECNPACESAYFGKARVLVNEGRIDEAHPVAMKMKEVASDEFMNQPSTQALLSIASPS